MQVFKKTNLLYAALIFLMTTGIFYLLFLDSTNISESKLSEPETLIHKMKTTKMRDDSKIYKLSKTQLLTHLRDEISKYATVNQEALLLAYRIDKEFDLFKEGVIAIVKDENESELLRILMLEILNRNYKDGEVSMAILNLFHSDSTTLRVRGYAAMYLSIQKVDIAKKLHERVDTIENEETPFYIRALKNLNYDKAVESVQNILTHSEDFNIRLASIEALGGFSDEESKSTELLKSIVYLKGGLMREDPSYENEVEAMRSITALAEIGEKSLDTLLSLADDAALSIDVRMRAIESLTQIETTQKDKIQAKLTSIETSLNSSTLLANEIDILTFMIQTTRTKLQHKNNISGA